VFAVTQQQEAPGAAQRATTEAGHPARTPEAEKPEKGDAEAFPERVHCWPYLTRLEFLAALIVLIVLVVWSIVIDAPLEEAANPTKTPNPSKAPWYFLGLQEMLVYFDPWIAGVVLPGLIIIGLMVIPYIDVNPRGNGYYSFRERWPEIATFLFGFLVLWVALIVVGVFFRGPGWNLFWPWQEWDPHKVVALTNVDLPYWGPFGWLGRKVPWLENPKIFGVEIIGMLAVGGWYGLGLLFYWWKKDDPRMRRYGTLRYSVIAFLLLTMAALPVKMALRLAFNIKYVWVTPWFNI